MIELTSDERRELNFLASNPWHGNTTVRTKTVQHLMLATGGTVIAQGRLFNLKADQLCPGVFRLSLEIANGPVAESIARFGKEPA